jgi:predicted lipoprotein with Yx(FWY)xxD motif
VRASMKFLIPAIGASLFLAACGGSSSSSSTQGSGSTAGQSALVKTAQNQQLGGTILVNAQGLTLYHLSGEQGGKFICTNTSCLQAWHPLVSATGAAPSGVSSLGVVKRPDGKQQVTYKGMPLYTFAQDTSPGQANGQGLKDVGTWSAVTTSGSGGQAAPASSSTSTSRGYGY